ncbi:MAG TPA: YegS/Rv2252/BmrU family lipid kinase [Gemmatimonadaceae bacterium]|nr:YegS/Rv2252/BmrU family lipid kinase [Gemmatimonadaceae bacterium]
MQERTCVIVNPAAGRGRGAKMIPEVAAAFAAHGVTDVRPTRSRGDEAPLTKAALDDGCTTIVAVGGDGTVSNVANAILHSGSNARLAVLPAGTGNDFAKLLGTARIEPRAMARLCAEAPGQRVDAARIEETYFINCCGFGFDVAVLEGIARNARLRGNAVYVYTALTEILGYRGSEIAIRSSASDRPRALHMMLVIANASFFGGTFEIAPGASAIDGKLDAVSLLDIPAWKRIAVLGAAILGKHERFAECVRERASSFELTFPFPPSYETDGEVHHAASATLAVTSCPAALRVVAAQPLR